MPYIILSNMSSAKCLPVRREKNLPNVQKERGGVKGVLNNVKKNCKIGKVGHPLAHTEGIYDD